MNFKGKTHKDYINSYIGKGITLHSATNLAIGQAKKEIEAYPNDPQLKEILHYLDKVKLSNEYKAMSKYEGLLERLGNVSIPDEIRLNKAENVVDVPKYINTLQSQLEKQVILSEIWKSNYLKLFNLVLFLEGK